MPRPFTPLSCCALALAACSPNGSSPAAPGPAALGLSVRGHAAVRLRSTSPIQHVVVIIQENRTFDNLFNGYPGANTVTQGLDSAGQTLPLKEIPLDDRSVVGHELTDFLSAYDGGKMDGFDLETGGGAPGYYAYERTRKGDVRTYWDIAAQYVLADNHFPSNLDSSFVAHQYLIAAQAQSAVDIPSANWGCTEGYDEVPTITQQRTYGPGESPCFDYTTIADELDAADLTWRYYAPAVSVAGGTWSAYQAIDHIYQYGQGPLWTADVISPETKVLSLAPDGTLPAVTWVVPSVVNSDHPGLTKDTGPSWVASVVNAIGESPYWSSTAIFVLWDDWGGFYDHVPPPQKDYDGLGIRTPLLCISPYAHKGVVSHEQYESAGILRFIEDTFGLQQLAAADARATSAAKGCLDYTQQPRPFTPFTKLKYSREFFLRQAPDYRPPDTDF
jgi:phospholipase C